MKFSQTAKFVSRFFFFALNKTPKRAMMEDETRPNQAYATES